MLLPVYFLLLLVSAIDIRAHRIPNKILLLLFLYALCFLYLEKGLLAGATRATSVLFLLLTIDVLSRSAIGMGDIKLIVLLALFMTSSQMISASLFAAMVLSGALGLVWILLGRDFGNHIPFGPVIALSFIVGSIFSSTNQ